MTASPKPPPPERNLAPPLWHILTPQEQDAIRVRFGLANGWKPPAEPDQPLEKRLESLPELARVMRMKPGRIGQLKEELIQRVDRPEGEE